MSVTLQLTNAEAELLLQEADAKLREDHYKGREQRMSFEQKRMWETIFRDLRGPLRSRQW